MKHVFLSLLSRTLLLLPVVVSSLAALAATPALNALPGKGLAEHNFFYAGEAKEENLYKSGKAGRLRFALVDASRRPRPVHDDPNSG